MNLKCIIDPNEKPKIIKHLKENIGDNLCDLGVDKEILDSTSKV